MDVALTTTSLYEPAVLPTEPPDRIETSPSAVATDRDELFFGLGLWLSGLESFLKLQNHSFLEETRARAATRDWTKEFRLTHSTLLLCSRLTFQLTKLLKAQKHSKTADSGNDLMDALGLEAAVEEIDAPELGRLTAVLKDVVLLNEGLLRAAPLKFGEWTAWSRALSEKLESVALVGKLIARAEKTGERFLPEVLTALLESKPLPFATEADLRLVLPRFAKILKWLSVIETMLQTDEPLKPSLLIFSRIYEQIQETTAFINNRLLRFPNEEDELFAQLDGAAYTASIELRKVYNYELAGLSEMRSTPLIYAKIETAFALLNDSFQLTLINFAQLIDPNIETHRIFPKLKVKLDHSLALRQNLWHLLRSVKEAEQNPDKYPMRELYGQMSDFLKTSVNFLFYKDRETVERFIEEVLVTHNRKDLVPILHRFGAYIETLFGQVNMRVVLAGFPFDYES
ncbi:MAG: hypothetical protein JSS81_24055 [Acidobacteria bacterium]|nr:hypothetical protein [Acidobacteriota bacterium]